MTEQVTITLTLDDWGLFSAGSVLTELGMQMMHGNISISAMREGIAIENNEDQLIGVARLTARLTPAWPTDPGISAKDVADFLAILHLNKDSEQ